MSIPDDVDMDDPTLEEINASTHDGTLEGSSNIPPLDVNQLQEEANKALGCLLVTRSTIDGCWRKEVSDFGMALCQIESEVTKAIKTANALCAHTIRKAEAYHMALISKDKMQHATCIKEVEADCASALAEAENCCSAAIR